MFAARNRIIWAYGRSIGCLLMLVVFFALQTPHPADAVTCTYQNPLVDRGQDPSVVYHAGNYYLVQSAASGLAIRKAAQLTDLGHVPNVPVYQPPLGQPYSYDLSAPELQYIARHWYIYFAADDSPGHNIAHRIYALEANTDDPLGSWTFKGKVFDEASDMWAIDASIFNLNDQLYMIWSGWPGAKGDFPQNLYVAHMSDPVTIDSPRVMIATPDTAWEKSVQPIEEGPEPFIHNGQLSIIYSADASWTTSYKLGMLTLTGTDPLNASAWKKVGPVFAGYTDATGAVYGTGHNSQPVTSPDGAQSWLIYASKTVATDGWDDRAIEMQPFTWKADNTPDFGKAIPQKVGVALPSGEPCGLISAWPLTDGQGTVVRDSNGNTAAVTGAPQWTSEQTGNALQFNGTTDFLNLGKRLVDINGSFSVSAWVNLSRTDNAATFVSQDGGFVSGFSLGYMPTQGSAFVFSMGNGLGSQSVYAVSTFSPTPNTWYSVVGVRDATANQLRLYVNGALQKTATYTPDWSALGNTIIGAAKRKAQRTEFFAGSLKDVRFYDGALSDAEITALYGAPVSFF